MIRSEHMNSCLTAQIRFMLFKGPVSFKKNFKIGGNVDELKGYRLIPLTPPLFFHFTLPLKLQFPSNYLKNVIDILKQIPASRRMSHREHALRRDEVRGEGERGKGGVGKEKKE
jgi:hypothetical protein